METNAWFPTLICLFMVMVNRMMKYITRIGQKTGTLSASKHVHIIPTTTAFTALYLQHRDDKDCFTLVPH